MRRIALVLPFLLVLAAAPAAQAGGFATVGLSSSPAGVAPGQPWTVELTVLQHGRTPLQGISPAIRIHSADGATARTFPARATGKPGVYRAAVVFPSAGRWTYEALDGFVPGFAHTFPPVDVGGPGAAAPAAARDAVESGGPAVGWLLGAGAALVAAALVLLAPRARRPREGGPVPA